MTEDYKLANRARQELKRRELREEILSCDSQKALDLVLSSPSPATLVQSFPDQDLYYLMHKIGVHDFLPVLAMASSEQWEYILDVEVWDEDRMDLHLVAQVLGHLFAADPQRLLRWGIMKKPEFMEFFLFHHMQVVVREHDEPPPEDFDDYITLDDKFYFRFPDRKPEDGGEAELLPQDLPDDMPRHDDAPELIESMLKTLAAMDLTVFHGLLLETCALLSSEAEEEEYRLKNIRLAEKGFLPPHEAIGIYQPAATLRKRPPTAARLGDAAGFDSDRPLPPQFFNQYIDDDSFLFVRAAHRLRERQQAGRPAGDLADIHNELAALINKVISADRVKIRNPKDIQDVMAKACAYLSLGIEVLSKGAPDADRAADILQTHFVEDLFRIGSREGIRLKARASAWHGNSFIKENRLPLSFLGESFLGVLGGLFIDRPMFFANYADKALYRHFRSLADVRATGRILDEIMAVDDLLTALAPDLATFSRGVLTYKSLILTLWAKNRIGLAPDLSPIALSAFTPFFAGLFSQGRILEETAKDLAVFAAGALGCDPSELPTALQLQLFALIRELEEEYGAVDPSKGDIRFMPHFLLSEDSDA